MTKTLILLVAIAALFLAGSAQAKIIEGTGGPDVLEGTAYGDKIYGFGGSDTITAKSGGDYAEGGWGADTLDMGCGFDNPVGNKGEDLIYVDCDDGKGDTVDCGPDHDIVFWRVPGTVLFPNCEDTFRVTTSGDAVKSRRHPLGFFDGH